MCQIGCTLNAKLPETDTARFVCRVLDVETCLSWNVVGEMTFTVCTFATVYDLSSLADKIVLLSTIVDNKYWYYFVITV